MKDFQLRNDTKLLFRNNPVKDLKEYVNKKKVLFVYGGGSVKRNGCYKKKSNAVTPELYWGRAAGGNIGVGEAFLYDATNIRLRNITVGYDFEKKWLEKTPLQKVRVSFVANNVWMIVNHLEGIDPESISATNSNATGFENGAAPTSRSFTFNVTVGF